VIQRKLSCFLFSLLTLVLPPLAAMSQDNPSITSSSTNTTNGDDFGWQTTIYSPIDLAEVELTFTSIDNTLSIGESNFATLASILQPVISLNIAVVAPDEKIFIRYGSPDTKEKLAADAKAAKDEIGIHGVSVIFRKPPTTGKPFGQTTKKAIEDAGFTITQTGKTKSHYTVTLPDPVTDDVAKKFNDLFTIVDPDPED
jgi:hypothetical protein